MSPETRPKSSGTLEKRAPDRRWAGTIVSIRNDLALDKQNGGWLLRFHRCTLYIIYMYIWNFQSWSNISSWSEVHYLSVNWSLHHWPVKDDANTPRSAQSGWSAVCSLQSLRLFSMLRLKKSSPLLPRTCQGPQKLMGSEQEAISYYFQRGLLPHLPCKGIHICPSYPYRKLTKILTSEGHIFDQELAFYLLEVSCPIFYFVLKTISIINKEC